MLELDYFKMQKMTTASIKSTHTPCIGICSTVFGDQICRGCKRSMHEITLWNQYNDDEKDLIWQRLESQMVLAVRQIFILVDPSRLAQQLLTLKITFPQQLDAHCWVIYLLRATKNQSIPMHQFGLTIRAEYQIFRPSELYDFIQDKWLTLALAQYDIQTNRALQQYQANQK